MGRERHDQRREPGGQAGPERHQPPVDEPERPRHPVLRDDAPEAVGGALGPVDPQDFVGEGLHEFAALDVLDEAGEAILAAALGWSDVGGGGA